MRNVFPYLTVAFFISFSSWAQNSGTLQGEALDALNLSPLNNWTVEVIQGTFTQQTTVDAEGGFIFQSLP
ncbi:MAG: hypothetical protein ACPH86_00840, partial [Schleiferiaceae bacterium]